MEETKGESGGVGKPEHADQSRDAGSTRRQVRKGESRSEWDSHGGYQKSFGESTSLGMAQHTRPAEGPDVPRMSL